MKQRKKTQTSTFGDDAIVEMRFTRLYSSEDPNYKQGRPSARTAFSGCRPILPGTEGVGENRG